MHDGSRPSLCVDFEKEFRLETDASNDGLGAVLLQQDDEKQWHPVAFASRKLKGGEPKYHSSKLEFLALKWAVTEQFREYLQYKEFTVRTDNNPLTYILTTPGLDALGHCWVAALAGFNMKLSYLKGTDNKVADALSRVRQKLDKETVTELLNCAGIGNTPSGGGRQHQRDTRGGTSEPGDHSPKYPYCEAT